MSLTPSSPSSSRLALRSEALLLRRDRPRTRLAERDQGSQFNSRAFVRRIVDFGLLPSMGSVGDSCDNATIEAFWSRMQVELLDRQISSARIRSGQRHLRASGDSSTIANGVLGAEYAHTRSSSRLDINIRRR